ncbi:hypothetical protein Rin_00009070 [Candidatus Regiella insecticola 5.15]|uniref:Uncharacterized protein n=1 Tax=Candidatus Regiella insecticola 5.15 TaxID=1005043 RepID=G2GYP7_9ENTR|nr:hypothetical protein Rin_00009070 [Candidatus Regiella insecticola 5.15]
MRGRTRRAIPGRCSFSSSGFLNPLENFLLLANTGSNKARMLIHVRVFVKKQRRCFDPFFMLKKVLNSLLDFVHFT